MGVAFTEEEESWLDVYDLLSGSQRAAVLMLANTLLLSPDIAERFDALVGRAQRFRHLQAGEKNT